MAPTEPCWAAQGRFVFFCLWLPLLSLAGLLVPIPLMALEMLTGAVQAYIFGALAMVFIGSAISENGARPPSKQESPA